MGLLLSVTINDFDFGILINREQCLRVLSMPICVNRLRIVSENSVDCPRGGLQNKSLSHCFLLVGKFAPPLIKHNLFQKTMMPTTIFLNSAYKFLGDLVYELIGDFEKFISCCDAFLDEFFAFISEFFIRI